MIFIFDFKHLLFNKTFDAGRAGPFTRAVLATVVVNTQCLLIEDFFKVKELSFIIEIPLPLHYEILRALQVQLQSFNPHNGNVPLQ
jgi:hypothetical protein